jgi:hypothetical protein
MEQNMTSVLLRPQCLKQVFASVELAESFAHFMELHGIGGHDVIVECSICGRVHISRETIQHE